MVDLTKITMNSLYGQSIQKDIEEEYIIRSENWLVKNNDERVVDYEPQPTGENVIKNISDLGIDRIKEVEKSMPSHFDIFALSHTKRIMNKLVQEIDGFYSNKVYYQDTDSLYTHKDHYQKLKSAAYVGNKSGQGKNDYEDGNKFYRLFLATKTKLCYTTDKQGIPNEKKTFEGYDDSEILLETCKYFKLKDGRTVIGEFPLQWKRSLGRGKNIDKKETAIKEFKSF